MCLTNVLFFHPGCHSAHIVFSFTMTFFNDTFIFNLYSSAILTCVHTYICSEDLCKISIIWKIIGWINNNYFRLAQTGTHSVIFQQGFNKGCFVFQSIKGHQLSFFYSFLGGKFRSTLALFLGFCKFEWPHLRLFLNPLVLKRNSIVIPLWTQVQM